MSALMCLREYEWKNRGIGQFSSKFGLEHSVLKNVIEINL